MKSATMKDALGSVAADRTAAVFKACQEWESELAQLSDSKLLSKVKVSREDSLKTVDELRAVMQQVKCDVSESEKGMIEALMSENLTGPGVRALKVLTNALRAAARLIEEKDFLVVSAIEKYILLERKLALLEAETEEQRLMWKRRRNLFHQQCIALSRCGQRHLLPAGVARPDPMMRREVSKWLARNAYGDNKNKYPCVMMDTDLPAPKRRARKPQLATEDSAQKTPDLEKTSSPFRQANAGAQMGDSLLIDDSKLLPPTQPAENTEPQSAHLNVRDDSKLAPPNRPAADAQKDDSAVSDDGAKVSGNPDAHAKASPGSPQAASPFVRPCGPPAANPCAAPMGPWGNLDADTAYWWYMQNKLWQEAQEWYDHDWAPAMMASWSDEREFTPPYPLSPMPPPASSQPFGPWWGPPSCDKWADDTGYPPDMRYFHHGTMSETQAADEYMVPGYTDTPPPPTKLYKESGTDAPKRMMTAEAQTAAPTSVSEAQTTRQMVAPAAHTQQPPMGQPTPSRSLPVMPLFGNGSEKYVNSQQRSEPGSPGNDAHSDAKSREVARARMEDEIRRKKRELGLSTNMSVGTSEALPQRRESAQPVTSGRALEDSTMPRISTQSKFGTRLEVPSHSQPGRRRSDDATTALSAPRLVLSDAAPASPVSHHTRPTEHRPEQPASRKGNTQLERDEEHRTHGRTLAESSPKNQEAFYDTTGMPRVDSPHDAPELYRDSFYENDNATYHRLRSGAGATDQYYRPNAPYPGTDPIDQYYSPNAPYAGADPTYQHHPPNAAYADSDATDQYCNPSGTYQDAGVTDQYYSPSGPYQDASATDRYYRPNGPNQDIHETDQYYRPNAPYADRGASSYYRPSGELAGPADPDHRSNPNTECSAPTRQPAPTSSNSSRLRQNSNDELNSNYTNERSAYTQKPPPTSSNTSRSWQDPNDDLRSNRTSESSAYDQHSRPTIATSSSKPTPRLGLPPAKTSTARRGASSRNQDLMAPPSTAQRTSRNAPSSAGSTGSRRARLHARGATGTATYAF